MIPSGVGAESLAWPTKQLLVPPGLGSNILKSHRVVGALQTNENVNCGGSQVDTGECTVYEVQGVVPVVVSGVDLGSEQDNWGICVDPVRVYSAMANKRFAVAGVD